MGPSLNSPHCTHLFFLSYFEKCAFTLSRANDLDIRIFQLIVRKEYLDVFITKIGNKYYQVRWN